MESIFKEVPTIDSEKGETKDFPCDTNCVALWRFESDELTTDSEDSYNDGE